MEKYINIPETEKCFLRRFTALKRAHHVSNAALAEETGINENTIKSWSAYERLPNAMHLIILANYFNCDVDYLLGRIDNKTHDIESISDFTALSEGSIEVLHSLANKQAFKIPKIISAMIETENQTKIFENIRSFISANFDSFEMIDYISNDNGQTHVVCNNVEGKTNNLLINGIDIHTDVLQNTIFERIKTGLSIIKKQIKKQH